jgi:hypothetical protein
MSKQIKFCPVCNNSLIRIPHWYCKNCNRGFTNTETISEISKETSYLVFNKTLKKTGLAWAVQVAQNDQYWHSSGFDNLPSVIAHEYFHLRELFEQGQIYGALLQVKDTFEVLIKFSVSLLLAESLKEEQTEILNSALSNLLSKPPSFGDWVSTFFKLLNFKSISKLKVFPLISLPKEEKGYFENIVQWRNDVIGHGALSMVDDRAQQQEMEEKLGWLLKIIQRREQVYKGWSLCSPEKKIEFSGWKTIRALHDKESTTLHCEETAHIYIKDNNTDFNLLLSPFLRLQTCQICGYQDIFFFDQRRGKRYYFLDYGYGHKNQRLTSQEKEIENLLQGLSSLKDSENSVDQDYLRPELDDFLQKASIQDWKKPTYLLRWLTEQLKEHSKGVFILRMGSGMGKTTFCKALDPYGLDLINLREEYDSLAACYYINNDYRYHVNLFCYELNHHIQSSPDDKLLFPLKKAIPELSANSENPSVAFAEWLNFYVKEYQVRLGVKRVVILIDALDEIPTKELERRNILDFIPNPKYLTEGAYIFLTARLQKEVPPSIERKIRNINFTSPYEVNHDADENKQVLEEYLDRELKSVAESNQQRAAITQEIIAKGESCFLYVSFIKDMVLEGQINQADINALPQANKLYSHHLEVLEDVYPAKFMAYLKRLLLTLSTAFEPISVEQLMHLMGEPAINFRLLGYLRDIKGMLRVEHTPTGNLFSIAHDWLKISIEDYWKKDIPDFCETLITQALLDLEDKSLNAGSMYLYVYLLEYLSKTNDRKLQKKVFNNNTADLLLDIILRQFPTEAVKVSESQTIIKISENLIKIESNLEKNKEVAENRYPNRILAHLQCGNYKATNQDFNGAFGEFNKAINICEEQNKKDIRLSKLLIASLYLNRGAARSEIDYIQGAIEDYANANDIIMDWITNPEIEDPNLLFFPPLSTLSKTLSNYSATIVEFDAPKAIESASKAIALYNISKKKTKKHIADDDLAAAFQNRGNAKNKIQDIAGAVKDYDISIKILEKLRKQGKLSNENKLSAVYESRGSVKKHLNNIPGAIEDYKKAIEILKQLLKSDKLFNGDDLAMTYANCGEARLAGNDISGSIEELNNAIYIAENLKGKWGTANEMHLAWYYLKRGISKFTNEDIIGSIEDYNMAIRFYEQLQMRGVLTDEGAMLAGAYGNLGLSKYKINDLTGGIADISKGIIIREILNDKGILDNEDNLAKDFANRGIIKIDNNETREGINDLGRAIQIWETLKQNSKSIDENHLVKIYMALGNARENIGDTSGKIKDYTFAIEIMRALKKRNNLLDENSLAESYEERGTVKNNDNDVKGAIEDFSKSIKVRLALQQKGKSFEESDLVYTYIKRGFAKKRNNDMRGSINDLGKAIQIWETLKQKGKIIDENHLSQIYMTRGNARGNIGDISGRIEDYTFAIEIMKALKKRNNLLDENGLATAYNLRANDRSGLNDIQHSIEDYRNAIDIQEKIVSKKKCMETIDSLFMYYYNLFSVLKKKPDSNILCNFSKRAARIISTSLDCIEFSKDARANLSDLINLICEHPYLPENKKLIWQELKKQLI